MARRTFPRRSPGAAVAIAGAVALVVSAFLPWSAEFAGPTHSGFEHVDGYVTFGTGVLVLAIVLWRGWRRSARVAVGLASLVPLWLVAKWYAGITAEWASEPAIGLYGTLLGGLLGLSGALLGASVEESTPRIARIEGQSGGRNGDESS